MVTLSAFAWVPPFAQGLVRDLRVRWALEEAGQPYETRIVDFDSQNSDEYRALQPFGQVPALEESGFTMFESGAIVLRIARSSAALMPDDEAGQERATTWLFAALNTLEPHVMNLAITDIFNPDEPWSKGFRAVVVQMVRGRLDTLETWLEGRDYLEDRFTAGDLMLTTVLRNLRQTDILNDYPRLTAYQARCEARPAFQKALADQLKVFEGNAPPPGWHS